MRQVDLRMANLDLDLDGDLDRGLTAEGGGRVTKEGGGAP
jgi:hypothetical protein